MRRPRRVVVPTVSHPGRLEALWRGQQVFTMERPLVTGQRAKDVGSAWRCSRDGIALARTSLPWKTSWGTGRCQGRSAPFDLALGLGGEAGEREALVGRP